MSGFDLFLFSTDPGAVTRAAAAGIDGFIVDWEDKGKEERQRGADTEINHDTPEDLARVRAATRGRVLCRLNRSGPWTPAEIDEAVARGADEVLLPMVRGPAEVAAALECARGRCGVGILLETVEAFRNAPALARLPLSRAYVGLNDLSIGRGTRSIFEALIDGAVDQVRPRFAVPFGMAGLTRPDRGEPVPCRLLIAEMARLACDFSFLRRSWRRDVEGRDPGVEVPRLKAALRAAGQRSAEEIARDRGELIRTVEAAAGRSRASGGAAGTA